MVARAATRVEESLIDVGGADREAIEPVRARRKPEGTRRACCTRRDRDERL